MTNLDTVLRSMTFNFFGNGKHKVSPLNSITDKDSIFLDVRSKEEVETISFPLIHHLQVLNIPINEIPDRISEIPKNKDIGIFCASGVRSTMVYLYLQTRGYEKVRIIDGGYAEIVQELKPGKLLKHIVQNTMND
jgi:rhodanese-related sulfurtransferase